MRLDSLLRGENDAGAVALWIDTEGMAFEAISGAAGVLSRTVMIHVEVETIRCIGAGQRLFPDVEGALLDAGFVLLATDQPVSFPQFNGLFVRAEHLHAKASEIRWHAARGRMYRNVKQAVRPLVPPRLRRFLASRLAAVRRP
jgi:hypothetical protein